MNKKISQQFFRFINFTYFSYKIFKQSSAILLEFDFLRFSLVRSRRSLLTSRLVFSFLVCLLLNLTLEIDLMTDGSVALHDLSQRHRCISRWWEDKIQNQRQVLAVGIVGGLGIFEDVL